MFLSSPIHSQEHTQRPGNEDQHLGETSECVHDQKIRIPMPNTGHEHQQPAGEKRPERAGAGYREGMRPPHDSGDEQHHAGTGQYDLRKGERPVHRIAPAAAKCIA